MMVKSRLTLGVLIGLLVCAGCSYGPDKTPRSAGFWATHLLYSHVATGDDLNVTPALNGDRVSIGFNPTDSQSDVWRFYEEQLDTYDWSIQTNTPTEIKAHWTGCPAYDFTLQPDPGGKYAYAVDINNAGCDP
jgi:hypothetical protein